MEQLGLSVFISVFSLCGVTVWLDQDFGTALKASDVNFISEKSVWYKRGEKTDCVSPWMQSWSVLDCAQESWQYVTCQVKESGCCLILYCLSSPQRDGNLVWLRDDYISIVCTVCLRNLKVLGSPCVFLNLKHVQGTALRVLHGDLFIGCVFIDRREAGCDKRRAEASHHRAREHVWRAGSPLQLHPLLHCLRYWSHVRASWFFFVFACTYHWGSITRKHRWNLSVIPFD